jgi:hypothetical protein
MGDVEERKGFGGLGRRAAVVSVERTEGEDLLWAWGETRAEARSAAPPPGLGCQTARSYLE